MRRLFPDPTLEVKPSWAANIAFAHGARPRAAVNSAGSEAKLPLAAQRFDFLDSPGN
jgi:hypothetical protein